MKRLALFLAAFLLMGNTALAAPLVVAHDTNFKPFEFKDESGKYTGFDIELWAEIAKRAGLDFQFQPMDFNGIIPGLQTGNVDAAVAAITINPERAKVVDFSDPYYDTGLMIAVRTDDVAKYKDLDALAGKVIASKTGTSSADYLRDNYKNKAKEIKLFPNNDGMYFELITNGADAVFFDESVVRDFARVSEGKVTVTGPLYQGQSYGVAFPKGSPLVAKANEAIKAMKADGTYNTLYKKWFGVDPVSK